MSHTIQFTGHNEQNELQILGDGIAQYVKQQRDHEPIEPFAFFIRGIN